MKKFLILLCILAMPAFMNAVNAPGDPIPFNTGYVDPTSSETPRPKSPVCVPIVYQDGNVLTFGTSCDGCTLQLIDEDDDVVYSIVIPAGTTSLILPATLSGTFELQIIRDNWLFYADIEL